MTPDRLDVALLIREGRTVLSPVVLPGWTRVGVTCKPAQEVAA